MDKDRVVSRSELDNILVSVEEKITPLKNIPGFIGLDASFFSSHSAVLHLSNKVFAEMFFPNDNDDITVKKRSWDEKEGLIHTVSIELGNIKIFCIMTEQDLDSFMMKKAAITENEAKTETKIVTETAG